MATHVIQQVSDNLIKITVTVPKDKVADALQEAAKTISQVVNIPGFRPGAASYDVVKQRVGEMKILEEASEELIRASFLAAMIEEDLDVVGAPHFTMDVMVPGEDLVYSAEVALMPKIQKLADYTKLTVAPESTDPTAEVIAEAKKDLARMQTKEVRALAGHTLATGDKAVVNLTMKKGGVVLEGGESQNHGIYTHETYYIEGFVDQILGLAEGAEKIFTLKFPKDHYQKHLANTDVDFVVRLNEIFTLETPAIDDEFAKRLGLENTEALETKLKENLAMEGALTEKRRQEKACLDLLAQKSEFDNIPNILVNQEIDRMLQELEHSIGENGMELKDYLRSVGKSVAEIKLDFTPTALTRVKVALIIRDVAKKEDITADAATVDAELDKIAERMGENNEYRERIYSPEYREFVESQVRNRAVVDHIMKAMVR
ncbi:MAG: trigger factor [Patescibacteria group bacterium]